MDTNCTIKVTFIESPFFERSFPHGNVPVVWTLQVPELTDEGQYPPIW